MAEAADRFERGVERGSAGGVVNEIEAPAFRLYPFATGRPLRSAARMSLGRSAPVASAAVA